MTRLVFGAVLGLTAWTGIVIMWRAIVPRRITLAARLYSAARPLPPGSQHRSGLVAISTVLAGGVTELDDVKSDLAVLRKTTSQFVIERMIFVALLGVMPLGLVVSTELSGAISWNPSAVILLVLAAIAFGVAMSRVALRSSASERRRGWVSELAAYLDIVSLMLSAGEGPEGALVRGARGATSPGIVQIRDALFEARLRRRSTWDALDQLSKELRVPELEELVAAVQLAATQGAPVKDSLMTKAQSLRDHIAADELAHAEVRSEKLGLPIMLMIISMLILLVGPYLAAILAF